jgi:hypothetical protein
MQRGFQIQKNQQVPHLISLALTNLTLPRASYVILLMNKNKAVSSSIRLIVHRKSKSRFFLGLKSELIFSFFVIIKPPFFFLQS